MENRRQFIKNGLVVVIGAGGLSLGACASHVSSFLPSKGKKWGMIIDVSRCSGCQSCMVACKLQNKTMPGQFNTTVSDYETGAYPAAQFSFDIEMCHHCKPAPCVDACPTGAAFTHESGLVLTDWNLCDGNGACIDACPFDARFHDIRFSGKTDKCDLCLERISQGLVPACVENCSSNARIFGRFDQPEGEFAEYLAQISSADLKTGAVHIISNTTKKEQK
nr:4Fe-4S dicluster domain-containing protein [uncultured Desulfobacter sp.]